MKEASRKKMNKLTIVVEPAVYKGLHEKVGRGNISQYINDKVKPFVTDDAWLIQGYKEMAQDSQQNVEAKEWEKIESAISTDNPW